MKNITRDDISEFIFQEFGLAKKDCNDLVHDIIQQISIGLKKNDYVKIHNFGTFKIKSKSERIGRNPKTKEEVMIEARKVISFIPSKNFVKIINNKDG
tara:strand:- start:21 stop:314 length:294 start_codon:yes stop_codon:yes gene_type:complete